MLICAVAASGWLNPDFPKGHDAISTICSAATLKAFFINHAPLLDCSGYGTVSSLFLESRLLHGLLLVIGLLLTWAIAAKLLFFVLFALSAVSTYYYTYELTRSRPGSLVAGLAYAFAPYYLIEVVFEGHWSFGAQYMLTPLVFLATEKAIQQPKPARLVLAGLSLALLIALGHPQTLPILIGPFLGLYMLFRIWMSGKRRLQITIATCTIIWSVGLSLTAFWWLPLFREIGYYHPTFSIEAAEWYSATVAQAITLRPHHLCCAPTSAWGASGSLLTQIVQFTPFLLALLGVILNRRNKYVWFFSACILVALLLAMGPSSPINLFEPVHSNLPFFSWLRTPVRFLLFASFAYAVLAGFCIKGVLHYLKVLRARKIKPSNIALIITLLVSLIVLANTWQESRTAFSTFTLPPDQSQALIYLAEQENGDYRIADSRFDTEAYDPEAGHIVNPTYWVFAHGKETLPGGMPATSTYAASVLSYLRSDLENCRLNVGEWLSVLNVKYVVMDKTSTLSSNVVLGEEFEPVWTSETIDIYENHSMTPRVFSFTNTNERIIDLHIGDTINVSYADGTQDAMLSLDSQYTVSSQFSLKSHYQFTTAQDSLCFKLSVEGITLDQDDAIHLAFYSEDSLPDVRLTLDLLEDDGSRYNAVLGALDGINAGWNEVNFPVSLLNLRYSTDEDDHLDYDHIESLYIGVERHEGSGKPHSFDLYFDKLSVVSRQANDNLQYTKIRPGKYEVHVNSDSPSCLVLSESYHPNWVARTEGKEIHSQIMYECLNGFYLEPGEYDVTLEFVNSPLRTAGNIISGISFFAICCAAVFLLLRARRRKASAKQHVAGSENPAA